MHEEVFRGTVSEALDQFREPRGEFTLVIEGAQGVVARTAAAPGEVGERLAELRAAGVKGREAARLVAAETGWPQREVYRIWTETGKRVPPG